MVWNISPVDLLSGDEKYYIFGTGTYTVGRKGCDVIVKSEKSVSRVHAKIIVDFKNEIACNLLIKDCSKYGTFIAKKNEIKEKVHEFPDKQTSVEDGDVLSFGTGNAIYKVSLVPFVFFLYPTGKFRDNTRERAVSIGARVVDYLSDDCTHVVVNEVLHMNQNLIDIIVSQKHVVLQSWVDILSEKNIRTEVPSCDSYTPCVKFQEISVKLADPKSRAACLLGYTCILSSKDKYKTGNKLSSLLQTSGALMMSFEDFCQDSQNLRLDLHKQLLYVVPTGSDILSNDNKLSSLFRVKEVDIVCAVLSGHLDSSILISPPVTVSSSCSTEDTVVADSDAETETAVSDECLSNEIHERIPETNQSNVSRVDVKIERQEASYISPTKQFEDLATKMTAVNPTDDALAIGKCDIIYCHDLISRDKKYNQFFLSSDANLPNFKSFKRKNSQSGNSFSNLIPYSKNPFRDVDYENKYCRDSMKEEKKRKQMEAIAEDLFINEKPRRKALAGTLHGLLQK